MKVLIVDDEADVQPLFLQRFRREIKNNEIELSFSKSGEEAFAYLQDHASEKVVILSDINMPGISGLDLLKQVREKYKEEPPTIMMVTAYGDEENYQRAMAFGADDFLTKPLDFTVLKDKIKTLAS